MKIVVVLGMHRSGTSAITRGLRVLGVNLGDHLVPPEAGYNDKGFFEDLNFLQLNEELLAALGSGSAAQPLIPDSIFDPEKIALFKLRALALLRARLEASRGTFAFKDPRTARLLPFWRSVFAEVEAEICYLIVIRHPSSVAKSLQKAGAPWEKSCYLWLDYVTAAVLNTQNQKRMVIDYDRLMDDPEVELKRVADCFGLPFDPASAAFEKYSRQFLENHLRHTRYDPGDSEIDPIAWPDLINIHRLLVQVSRDLLPVDAVEMREGFLEVRQRLLRMNPAFEYIARLELENFKLREALDSIEEWQRSWIRRAFHRWRPPGSKRMEGLMKRFGCSIARCFPKLKRQTDAVDAVPAKKLGTAMAGERNS